MNTRSDRARRFPPRRLAWSAPLAALACSLALAASPVRMPSIGGPGPVEHHPGKIIWADLVTPDLAVVETFYAGLFGWTFEPIHSGGTDYAIAMREGRPIAGLLQKPIAAGEHQQPAWLTFVASRDVDRAERTAKSHGARSVSPARTFPGRGRQAVFADPEGAVFAVLASSSGDPPDNLAAPGEWIWSSLLANEPAQSAAFYKAVFGYDIYDLPGDEEKGHLILSSDDYARASVNVLPTGGHRHPHWINYIRVIDAQATAAKAAKLGGRILVEPFEDRHGGKIAVVADPGGAPVGLMEWSETDTKEEPK